MPNTLFSNPGRRRFLGFAALSAAALDPGPFGRAARAATPLDSGALPAPRQIDAGPLSVGYVEMGPSDGPAVMLLHGWPYDIHSFAEVAPRLAAAGYRVVVPYLRGYGTTIFRSPATPRNAQQAVLAADAIALMDALHIRRALFAGFDWGARTADIVAALWPKRCTGLVSVSGYLIGSQQANAAPLPPKAELSWWYQFYFATERGRLGYARNTKDFNRLIWQLASPLNPDTGTGTGGDPGCGGTRRDVVGRESAVACRVWGLQGGCDAPGGADSGFGTWGGFTPSADSGIGTVGAGRSGVSQRVVIGS